MKVLSILALMMFVSTHAFANSAKPAEKAPQAAEVAAQVQKTENQAAPQEDNAAQPAKKSAKKKKH